MPELGLPIRARRSAGPDALEPHRDGLGPCAAGARVGGDLVAEGELPGDARRDAAGHHLLDRRRAEAPHLAGVVAQKAHGMIRESHLEDLQLVTDAHHGIVRRKGGVVPPIIPKIEQALWARP